MSDRNAILETLRKNRPATIPLPEINLARSNQGDLLEKFKSVMAEVGGQAIETEVHLVDAALLKRYPEFKVVKSGEILDRSMLPELQVFVLYGKFGVAENGAVWVPEDVIQERVAPFITQHLAIVLDKTRIVEDMHVAYEQIDVAASGFGVFIAGPSKTADIEQSLVLGAHGPRSLTVLLV